jgi:hypothetical protein
MTRIGNQTEVPATRSFIHHPNKHEINHKERGHKSSEGRLKSSESALNARLLMLP